MANRIVEEKIADISEKTMKDLDGNSNLKEELDSKIRSIINEEEIKTSNEEINDLAEIISKKLGIENNSEVKIEAKKIRIEVQKWKDENITEVENFRKEEFEKKFEEETKKLNPDLKNEELDKVKEYGKLVSETYSKKSIIENQKDEALQANEQLYSPGKLENGWVDLRVITIFLTKKPEEIKEIKNKYDSIKNSLRNVNLPNNLKESRSFENVISNFNNQGQSNLFSRTQKYLGWADRIDKLTGGWLNKTVTDAGMRMVSNIGNQAIQEFATNSLNVMAQQGFQKGFSTVLNGIMSGGVKAATTTAVSGAVGTTAAVGTAAVGVAGTTAVGVAGTTAAVVGGAAVSATGVGAIVVAALAVLKVVKDVAGKIADKLGINFKKALQENFGKVGGAMINGAIFVVGLPILLIGMISMAVIGPILLLVFGGLFGYQILQGNSVSSLVPPKTLDNSTATQLSYISTSGPIVLPTVDPSQPVNGQMVVDMASSLVNKVCYYFGGGHSHFWPPESEKGSGLNWGQKTYVNSAGITKEFGDNTQFGSDNHRTVYGLDCSGFVGWVYHQFGMYVGGVAASIYDQGEKISRDQLQPGDLGFLSDLGHVGIFAGKDSSGNLLWIHSGSGGYLDTCGGQLGFVKLGTYSGFVRFVRAL